VYGRAARRSTGVVRLLITKLTKEHEGGQATPPTQLLLLLFFVSFVSFVASW
jgi:hypothetical protein